MLIYQDREAGPLGQRVSGRGSFYPLRAPKNGAIMEGVFWQYENL